MFCIRAHVARPALSLNNRHTPSKDEAEYGRNDATPIRPKAEHTSKDVSNRHTCSDPWPREGAGVGWYSGVPGSTWTPKSTFVPQVPNLDTQGTTLQLNVAFSARRGVPNPAAHGLQNVVMCGAADI